MGLQGEGGTYESGGSKGMSGSGNYGNDRDKKKKDEETEYDRLLKSFKYGGLVNPAFSLFAGITMAAEAYEQHLKDTMDPADYAAMKEQGLKDESAREAARNEKADLERNRLVRPQITSANASATAPIVPKPIVTTPTLGTTYVPGLMGTPTVKKRKLLGGDLIKRI